MSRRLSYREAAEQALQVLYDAEERRLQSAIREASREEEDVD